MKSKKWNLLRLDLLKRRREKSRKLPAFCVDHCACHKVLHRWMEEQTELKDDTFSLISPNQ